MMEEGDGAKREDAAWHIKIDMRDVMGGAGALLALGGAAAFHWGAALFVAGCALFWFAFAIARR